MTRAALPIAAGAVLISLAALAAEPPACPPGWAARARIADILAATGETRIGAGATAGGRAIVEVWRDQTRGGWTILLTLPAGCTRPLHLGLGWVDATPPEPGIDG